MNLNNAIARAQRMMLDENFNRDVERAARAHRGSGVRNSGGNDLADLDAAVFGVSSSQPGADMYAKVPLQEGNYGQPSNTSNYNGVQMIKEVHERRDPRTSKLPAAIVESFERTPSPVDAFDISGGALAGLNFETEQPVAQPQVIREQVTVPQGQVVGGVNYDLIKFIVKEAVNEALKGQLNESVGIKGLRFGAGNVIQFLDNKDNLYEGVLTLKRKGKKK